MTEIEDVYLAIAELRREITDRLGEVPVDQPPTKPRRLTKDDVTAGLLAAATKTAPEHHSVSLKTNAKGEVQVEITVRAMPGSEFETPAAAFAEASRIYLMARDTLTLAGIAVSPQEGPRDGGQT